MTIRRILTRSALDKTLTLAGVIIILVQFLFIAYTRLQVVIVLTGMFMIYVGVWNIASRMLPDRRAYGALRSEVHDFLALVRRVNAQALGDDAAGVEATKAAMHASVDRMADFAGVRDKGT